ncbi:hypothetical protein vBAmePPT11V19_00065 [Alteromonas phage vB_AmeP_PT11-V19]|nr:hypothetical protein vBAmePPT11V19_00065 [Alteromonas phage vB_AmeP_PT11-V19]
MMDKVSAKALVATMAALVGSKVNTAEPIEPKEFLDSQRDLTVKTKKPINGYQAKQRKRKQKKRGL